LKFGEQAETAAEYVAVCKAFQEVQEVTDVKCLKLNRKHHLHYVQERQDVADQYRDAKDVEVMLVQEQVVAMEHTFVYVHQEAVTDVALVIWERLQEHTADVQLMPVDVFTGQILQFADLMAAMQVHQCVQVQPSN